MLASGAYCRRHAIGDLPTIARSLRVAAVVGTALFAINQLDVVISGRVSAGVVGKIVLTYCVPFLVSSFAALASSRRRSPSRA